ncbi:TadE/TadG family type IV pilus assembly protein [uncultured Tateyamaria sp.]|uniref:TadE/TadG family type IV pilus assembly protein n=1 Tax=uncultured Tateyamaria sp. TaxID=455651 RepID=UPI002608AAC2|nr:TadE/TadG family type IV pilus assembly protein [uncultured Tateyamaria sp.]
MIRLIKHLRRFRDDERGSIAVETVLIIPALFWAYLAMFATFDAYRQHAVGIKAAYTIGDIISRETTPLNVDYLTGTRKLLAYLTANEETDVAVRITSIKYNGTDKEYRRHWSRKRGWMPALTDEQVNDMAYRLPVLPHNEHIMLVETFVKYDPPFDTGLKAREIHNAVFTRPRYAPRVLWSSDG